MPVDDDSDDTGPYARPLPPEDRLWRHPSEVSEATGGATTGAAAPRRRPWGVAVVAGLLGVALGTGLVIATGPRRDRVIERAVVERVAVNPVVSTPTGVDGMQEAVGSTTAAVVRVTAHAPDTTTTGSGVLFRSDGHILTSAHLLDSATAIDVALGDGRTLAGAVVGRDELTDVAVLKVEAQNLPTVIFGTTESLNVGSPVVAIGAPPREGDEPSMDAGVISAIGQRMQPDDGAPMQGMLQTDASLSAAADGGPLLDLRGSMVGLSTACCERQLGIRDARSRWRARSPGTSSSTVRLVMSGSASKGPTSHLTLPTSSVCRAE